MSREARKDDSSLASRHVRPFLALILISVCASYSLIWIHDPVIRRAMIVAGVCLTLWLTEVVPPYVPTLVLWALKLTVCVTKSDANPVVSFERFYP